MKTIRLLSSVLWVTFLCSLIEPVQVQSAIVAWRGKIAIGGNSTKINCNLNLKESGELYLQADTLQLTGNYSGESGSAIFFSTNANKTNFMNVSGTVTGTTELVPNIPDTWNGSFINLVKAQKEQSDANTFFVRERQTECNRYAPFLKHENATNNMSWYLYGTPVLPLIVQLANHTLLVNNNPLTNGGHNFTYYKWYRDGQLLKEGSHDEYGGSYYTGGASLDADAVYTVEATDADGKQYFSCPYQYIPFASSIHVSVYPNPVSRNVTAYIQAETQDLSLLKDAVVDIYDLTGQYAGQTEINGQIITPLDLPAKQGIYLLKFRAKDFIQTIKLIVE